MKDVQPLPHKGIKFADVCKTYRIFASHLRKYWKWFLFAYSGLVGSVIMDVVKPWPLKLILDYILLDKPMPEKIAHLSKTVNNNTLLIGLCVAIVLVVIVQSFLSYVNKYFMAAAGNSISNDVRQRVFDHLQLLSQSFHGSNRTGDLIVRLTSDINSIKKLLIGSVQDVAKYFVTFICLIVTMLWMDWQLTLVALAVVPSLYFMSFYFSKKVEVVAKSKRAKESEVASIVQETMISMPVIQAFTREKQEKKRFAKESKASLKADLNKAKLAGTFRRSSQIIVAIGTALTVWYGARRVLAGQITPGDLIVFTAYLKNMYSPISGFSVLIVGFITSLVATMRVAEILETDCQVQDSPDAVKAPPFNGEVRFENVSFGYKPDKPVLQNVSFSVRPGQFVALVGASGAGKSTVVNLLIRFFDPWEGRILIDGQDIRGFKLKSLREQISVVLQNPLLMRKSIGENIAYGKPQATFQEIIQASKAAKIHDFIMGLPDGYDTIIEERGGNLSGGQKQRIAIARALLRDTPILILDEPVTGLDAVTESQINSTLEVLMKDKTTFVIAHKLTTVKKADLILVIQEGKVIERGTHAELLENSSVYQHACNLQKLELA